VQWNRAGHYIFALRVKILWKSDDQFSRKSPLKCQKNAKIAKFQMPISPPNGGRFPRNKKCFCQVPWAITHMRQIGGPVPGSGKPLKCPNPKSTNYGGKNELLAKKRHVNFFTVVKYCPRSMKFVGWWTFSRRILGPQTPEMGSKCQFWKFQTPISPLNGGRFTRNKDRFSQLPGL